ncbi:myb-like DNA-binding domain-containing protein [Apiospora phragmitis]|uniref:Myb-like DNA-binding domain-containing protein n=1 Tax=Apiospora phragmitis TaxID=2905665 RepID=A0ABR1TYG7_9PEZI
MGAQQSQLVNEDDDRSSKIDQSQFSQDEDDHSDRDDLHDINGIDASERDQPVFSSQLPTSARRDRELGKMNSTKSRKRRSTRRSSDADQSLPPASSQDFDPPFIKHEPNGTQEEEDDEDTIMQVKGDPGALDEEPVAVLEDEEFGAEILEKAKRERRKRREMKKARRAEKLRLSQQKADSNAMDETDLHDASQVNGVSSEMHTTNGFVAVNHQVPASPEAVETSKPSKRRKRQAAASPVAEEAIQYDENGQVNNLALPTSSANDSVVPVSSPLKRKGRSLSDKKQHKKQKQQMDDVEEEDEGATQMSVPFADAAQDIYSQRYNEAQSSPSEARRQRRSQSRADSVEAEQSEDDIARHIKPDPARESDEEEVVPQTMDIDEDNDEDNEDGLPANSHDAERNTAEDAVDNENHLGSDDLGVAEPMEVDHDSSDDGLNGNAVPTPSSKDKTSGSANGQASRQSGSKPSTGRKRHAKRPFNETEQGEENNRQAIEELPAASPAVTAAKRRRGRGDAAGEEDDNAAAGPSSAANGKVETNGGTRAPFLKAPRKVQDPRKGDEITGPFSEFELRNIDKALKHWQEDHDLTDYDRNELIHQNPQNAAAKAAYCATMWDAIQAVVPQRKPSAVDATTTSTLGAPGPLNNMKNLFSSTKSTGKHRKIGGLINRFPEDVRDRIRNYVVCGDKLKTAAWDPAEENRLKDIIAASLEQIRSTIADPESDLNRGKKEEDLIDWQGVSEGMHRERSRLQCMIKWKKLKAAMDAEHNADVNPDESMAEIINNAREEAMQISGRDLSKIAKRIHDTGAISYGRIPWAKVHAEGVGAKYSRPTLIVAWCRMRTLVPGWEHATPLDIASTLRSKFREEGDLQLPTDINLEEEYKELEKKVVAMLNKNNKSKANKKTPKKKSASANHQQGRKSAYLAIKSDDEQEDREDDNEDRDDVNEGRDDDAAAASESSDVDMGVGPSSAKIPSDREIEESDLDEAPPTSTKAKGKGEAKAKPARRHSTKKTPKGKGKRKGVEPEHGGGRAEQRH